MAFRIVRNDITKVKADAIVNTANPNVEIGEAVITRSLHTEAKYIIYSCGPGWSDGLHQEEKMLRQCYDKCLDLAYKHHCKSIAFPLMFVGSYGFSQELSLKIALESFNTFFLHHEIEIILVVFEETTFRLSGKIFEDVRQFVDNSYVEHKVQKEYSHDRISGPRLGRKMLSASMMPWDSSSSSPVTHQENQSYSPMIHQESRSNAPALPKESSKLEFFMQQESGTFGGYLQQLINKKGMKNAEVYTAANLTKQYFSKLLKGQVTPSKTKILSLAIALRLNMDETIDFLRMSGYAFSPFSSVDKIFEYFIRNGVYDIYKIDMVLFDYGLPTLVND